MPRLSQNLTLKIQLHEEHTSSNVNLYLCKLEDSNLSWKGEQVQVLTYSLSRISVKACMVNSEFVVHNEVYPGRNPLHVVVVSQGGEVEVLVVNGKKGMISVPIELRKISRGDRVSVELFLEDRDDPSIRDLVLVVQSRILAQH